MKPLSDGAMNQSNQQHRFLTCNKIIVEAPAPQAQPSDWVRRFRETSLETEYLERKSGKQETSRDKYRKAKDF